MPMEITRDTVVEWLKKNHRSRAWLAKQCRVSDQAVSNWLREKNSQAISAAAEIKIRALMAEDEAKGEATPPQNLVLEFTDKEYTSIEQAALARGITIREWAKRLLNDASEMDVNEIAADLGGKISSFPSKPHLHAAAGSPVNAEVTDWDGADDTIMVGIYGLSMDPLLADGQVVPMRLKKSARNPFMKKGLIYLVEYDGGYSVKRYNTRKATEEEKGEEWVENGKVKVLESVNPTFPEIVIKQPLDWVAWLDQ